jgi:hypothetical protein
MSRPLPPFTPPYRVFLQVALIVGTLLSGLPLAAIAQTSNPPIDIGLPGRREGGGTRGCWRSDSTISSTDRLTALVPAQNFGYTSTNYPTFFVYVPQFYAENAVAAEFILSDEDDNELYKATFQTARTSGIISLSLPANANLPPLEVGKNYHWSFALICEMSDRSADVVVDSWIQRIEPSTTLQAELQQTSLEQRPSIYAQQGIWYDAISSLATLRSQTGGPVPASQWVNLLNSVGLVHITRETPIERINLSQSNQAINLGQ